MIYIGFSIQSHKKLARILCKKYRHCAPIIINKNKCVIYQFISYKKIVPIHVRARDLKTLKHFGWIFVQYSGKFAPARGLKSKTITCVQFTKCALNIKNIAIQTPDALLKYLTTNEKSPRGLISLSFLLRTFGKFQKH